MIPVVVQVAVTFCELLGATVTLSLVSHCSALLGIVAAVPAANV